MRYNEKFFENCENEVYECLFVPVIDPNDNHVYDSDFKKSYTKKEFELLIEYLFSKGYEEGFEKCKSDISNLLGLTRKIGDLEYELFKTTSRD